MGNCCLRGHSEFEVPLDQVPVELSDIKGPDIKVAGLNMSGHGTIYANTSLLQTRSYFELKIAEKGEFCLGVAVRSKEDLGKLLSQRKNSWGFYSGPDGGNFETGDIIGCSFDMSDVRPLLKFYHNGEPLEDATTNQVKGEVWPAFSVSGECTLQVNFGPTFSGSPPGQFDAIICSRDML
jgi:hypothetical protein